MKTRYLLPLLLLAFATTVRASIIYSGVQNVPIPLDPQNPQVSFDGVYLRIDSGATASTFPGDWSTRPWINPFFGGVYVGSSPLLRPVVAPSGTLGSERILNLGIGTVVSGASLFAAGENGSETHFGNGADQFALNTPGYLGVTFRSTPAGADFYGWIQMEIKTAPASPNVGEGRIISWAYEDVSGASIQVGNIGVVPESAGTVIGLLCLGLAAMRRRR